MDEFPEMPESHFDDMIPGMFYYAKWFMSQFQAYVMIGVAVALSFTMLVIIVNLFDRSKKDDDDDGYDYREF